MKPTKNSERPEYACWCAMNQRCSNKNRQEYKYYGARGIKVCATWRKSFAQFLLDVGPRPSDQHSLERMDNNGNYQPGNVKWALPDEQQANRRNSIKDLRGLEHVSVFRGYYGAMTWAARQLGITRIDIDGWLRGERSVCWPYGRRLITISGRIQRSGGRCISLKPRKTGNGLRQVFIKSMPFHEPVEVPCGNLTASALCNILRSASLVVGTPVTTKKQSDSVIVTKLHPSDIGVRRLRRPLQSLEGSHVS